LSLAGELDASSSPELERLLRQMDAEGEPSVVLDLSGLSFVDSAGVSVLVRARHDAEERGRMVVLLHPTPQVHGVFAMLGLAQWLDYGDGAGV
jgi:anti-anti-sigma factor